MEYFRFFFCFHALMPVNNIYLNFFFCLFLCCRYVIHMITIVMLTDENYWQSEILNLLVSIGLYFLWIFHAIAEIKDKTRVFINIMANLLLFSWCLHNAMCIMCAIYLATKQKDICALLHIGTLRVIFPKKMSVSYFSLKYTFAVLKSWIITHWS